MPVETKQASPALPPLITAQDVEAEIHRLFLAQAGSGLVIRVYGEEGGAAENIEAFREMFNSLRLYDYGSGAGDVFVDAPNSNVITRALNVLAREQHQKRILDHVLTTFGHRLIDPLAAILDTTPEGTIMSRLSVLRDLFLAQIAELKLTHESQDMLTQDLLMAFDDAYLRMVAEHEERVQRPRVRKLAQEILRVVGSTFHAALRDWPEHAENIAMLISRRMKGQVHLREVPTLIRGQICAAIEDFLWLETAGKIEGSLEPLFASHSGLLSGPVPTLDRSLYREFAEACWNIIADYS
jgi:hypothetical protein